MAEQFKTLGQVAPAADTWTALYNVPASKAAVVSTFSICNTSETAATRFRIAIRPNGEALAAKHYLFYNAVIGPTVTVSVTIGATVDAGDYVDVYAEDAHLTFMAFGTEMDA